MVENRRPVNKTTDSGQIVTKQNNLDAHQHHL